MEKGVYIEKSTWRREYIEESTGIREYICIAESVRRNDDVKRKVQGEGEFIKK